MLHLPLIAERRPESSRSLNKGCGRKVRRNNFSFDAVSGHRTIKNSVHWVRGMILGDDIRAVSKGVPSLCRNAPSGTHYPSPGRSH